MSLLPGTIWCEAEFQYDGPTLLTGSCGPNALAMALSWANQSYVSTVNVYRFMRNRGWCQDGGASNVFEIAEAASALGSVSAVRPYGEPWTLSLSWLDTQLAAGNAVVLNVANGQALVDAVTGKGENAHNLHYHFLTLVGRDDQGFFAVDGDNLSAPWRASTSVRQYYPVSVLLQARPCGAVGIARHTTQGGSMHIPPGWADTNAALIAPNKLTVVGAMRDYVLTYPPVWDSDDWPLEEAHDTGDGRIVQTFQFSQLRLTKVDGKVQRGNVGADLLAMQQQIVNDAAAIKTSTDEIIALHQQVAALQAQLNAKESTAAQTAIAALAAALKELG